MTELDAVAMAATGDAKADFFASIGKRAIRIVPSSSRRESWNPPNSVRGQHAIE